MPDWPGDIAMIGGDIVGPAAAWELLQRRPGTRMVLYEKARRLGRHADAATMVFTWKGEGSAERDPRSSAHHWTNIGMSLR